LTEYKDNNMTDKPFLTFYLLSLDTLFGLPKLAMAG